MSATTFVAVPRRLPVLGAQVLLTALVALLTASVSLLASILVTSGARGSSGLALNVTDPETVRVAVGFVLFLTGLAVLGVGLGALLRQPGSALMAAVGLLLVADQLLAANPGEVADTVRAVLPAGGARMFADDAGLAALAAGPGPDFGAWGGGLVLAAWMVAALVAAGYRLRWRDVT
jgi:ABC-2 type transport system permease protein